MITIAQFRKPSSFHFDRSFNEGVAMFVKAVAVWR